MRRASATGVRSSANCVLNVNAYGTSGSPPRFGEGRGEGSVGPAKVARTIAESSARRLCGRCRMADYCGEIGSDGSAWGKDGSMKFWKRAFTLIELLVVVAIIAILAALLL